MPRYKLTVEYDGEPFVGWQRQPNGPSVQAALEEAVFAFTGERPPVQAAGRTDTGVHARGQVVHLDLAAERPVETVRSALNFHLKPQPVAVVSAELAPAGFHARFSATGRRYRYRIINRRAPPALDRGQLWHVPVALDVGAMADAAARVSAAVGQCPWPRLPSLHVCLISERPRSRARPTAARQEDGPSIVGGQPRSATAATTIAPGTIDIRAADSP